TCFFLSPGSVSFDFINQPGTIGGVAFSNEDILRYDDTTDVWTLYFDGSDVGLGFNDLNAFHLEENGNLLLSLKNPQFISGLGWVDGTDIIRFIPTSIGPTTAGRFEWFFDGSDVGLNWYFEYLDAIGFSPDGRLVVSTRGWFFASNLFGLPQDLFVFNAQRFGADTAGSWELYFDGSDIGLSSSTENIAGLWIDPNNNDLYLSTTGGSRPQGGGVGTNADLLLCQQPTFGANSACTAVSVSFDGSSVGFTRPIDALSLELNDPPVAQDDAFSTDEDTPISGNVLADNGSGPDEDADSDPLTVTALNGSSADIGAQITLPSGALLTLNSDGSFSYDPSGAFEELGQDEPDQDSFEYTLSDGQGGTDTAMVTITITGVDDPPEAVDDTATIGEDSGANTLDVLANDTDVDGGPISITAVTQPTNGTVLITNFGADLTYQPDQDYCNDGTPTDDFTYTLTPGGTSATVQVTVTCVNDPPTALNDTATVNEDDPATAIDVLLNDTDPDGGSKLINAVTQPANGTVAITGGGTGLTYQPAADYCNAPPGTTLDTFTYTLTPGTSTATVSVTVTCVDDAPAVDLNGGVVAGIDFTATFTEGGGAVAIVDAAQLTVSDLDSPNLASATVTLTNLLDAGQETLAVDPATVAPNTLITAAYNGGTGVLDLTGAATLAEYQAVLRSLTYTDGSANPDPTARVITIVVNDGVNNSPPATSTVTVISVNSAPSFTKGADQTVNEDAGAQTVPGWATAIDDGDGGTQTLTFNITGNTNPGLFSAGPAVAADGMLTYTPAVDANGTATITITLSDDGGTANGGVDTSPAQTFAITVTPVNDAPSFTKGADQTVNEDAGLQTINPWATAISAGPADEAGQTLTFNITGNTNPGLLSAGPVISPTGVLTYTPAANASGSATITVNLRDNGGTANGGVDTSAVQTFAITVTAVDDPPTAVADPATVAEDAPATAINVLANDTDPDGGPISIASVTQPANGTVVITGGGTGLTYQPNLNYCNAPPGTTFDTFTYTLTPGGSTGTVTVTVTCVDDNPLAVADSATIAEDSGATAIDVLANDTDPDGGPISIASVTPPANGTVVITGGGTGLTYQPNADYCNSPPGTTLDTFTYTLSPGGSTATVSVTVNCLNDAPVIALPGPGVNYDTVTPVILDAAATVIDIDSPNFDTGVLTANVTTNCEAADRLGVRNEGTGPDQIGVSGADVTFNPGGSGVVTIGTIVTELDCTTPAPLLAITLTANADLTAIQALLRNLVFFSASSTPTDAPSGRRRAGLLSPPPLPPRHGKPGRAVLRSPPHGQRRDRVRHGGAPRGLRDRGPAGRGLLRLLRGDRLLPPRLHAGYAIDYV
ncbi:MAG: tandem-95 repeat protein, partial [Rhodobacteraceae bacterium]|nr:tandem-95 repeat protein [Paracoccaceae bacterium]